RDLVSEGKIRRAIDARAHPIEAKPKRAQDLRATPAADAVPRDVRAERRADHHGHDRHEFEVAVGQGAGGEDRWSDRDRRARLIPEDPEKEDPRGVVDRECRHRLLVRDRRRARGNPLTAKDPISVFPLMRSLPFIGSPSLSLLSTLTSCATSDLWASGVPRVSPRIDRCLIAHPVAAVRHLPTLGRRAPRAALPLGFEAQRLAGLRSRASLPTLGKCRASPGARRSEPSPCRALARGTALADCET